MISMEMRKVIQILMQAVMGTVKDIHTSPVVAKETAALPLNLMDGRLWVDRDIPSPSLSPLGTLVQAEVHTVLVLMTFFQTSSEVMRKVVTSLVVSVAGAILNLGLVLWGLSRL